MTRMNDLLAPLFMPERMAVWVALLNMDPDVMRRQEGIVAMNALNSLCGLCDAQYDKHVTAWKVHCREQRAFNAYAQGEMERAHYGRNV